MTYIYFEYKYIHKSYRKENCSTMSGKYMRINNFHSALTDS